MKENIEPAPSVLDNCEKLSSKPLAYKTGHFIVEAEKEYILKAVGWAKFIESNVYPIMVEMMGHKPTVDVHALHVVDRKLRGSEGPGAWFEGIKRFPNTQYVCSDIKIFHGKLSNIPPYRPEGDITHETIHGLLDETKNGRNRTTKWKPIWQSELLDRIFEIELSQRLGNKTKSEERYRKCLKKEGNYAVLAEFWNAYTWEPFKSLILCLHDDPDFPPGLFDHSGFTYYMSLFAKEDVSSFFEKQGWIIDNETKERIKKELQIRG